MTMAPLDPTDLRLLDEFQRDFPLVPRPFGVLGRALGLSEGDVLARLSHLRLQGMIARVGATVRPNTAGASTLAALKVPPPRLEAVAAQVGAETGVNHSYAREDDWNLWFVATAPDQAALACQLDRIRAATALPLLDLRLVRAFNIDLGFCLNGRPQPMGPDRKPKDRVLRPADRPLLHELVQGLDLVPAPYAALARQLGRDEAETVARIAQLAEARIISRLGIIVRHRPLGWTENAMTVWDLPEARVVPAGEALARLAGVTLCYQRNRVPGVWPFALYAMIHGRSRSDALDVLRAARTLPELQGAEHRVLFSTRCFKQTGAQITEAA